MEELDRKALPAGRVKRVIGVVGNLAPGLVIDLARNLGAGLRGRPIRLFNQLSRSLFERFETEWLRGAEFKARRVRLGFGRLHADRLHGARRSGHLQKGSAIWLIDHAIVLEPASISRGILSLKSLMIGVDASNASSGASAT